YVARDTREQNGWTWIEEEKKPGKCRLLGTNEYGLKTGDYSIMGLEDKLCIERKNGFSELFGNYSPKDHRERFEREMERMMEVPHRYILIETNLNYDTLGLS